MIPQAAASPQAGAYGQNDGASGWVATWAASPAGGDAPAGSGAPPCQAAAGVTDQTVRDVIFTHASGDQVRVRLTNSLGSQPLTIGSASIAVDQSGAQATPGTLRPLTFAGARSVTIAAGAEALSDPLSMHVAALQDLLVSVFVPGASGLATEHYLAEQFNYISTPGDFTQADSPTAYTTTNTCSLFVDGVSVHNPSVAGTVVALGDSITDGAGSTYNANARWPDDLARRLDSGQGPLLSVANAGINGNCVLETVPTEGYVGVNALARLDRDVFDQPGVRTVILFEGINDIGAFHVTADQLISGYEQIIAQTHARRLRIIGATLTPVEGSVYYSQANEATREAVNHWIRTSGAFDGVVDFDKTVRDPANPQQLLPAYDSGDHLHLSDAGYQALANAVDLQSLL